jgi:hypothetical protein
LSRQSTKKNELALKKRKFLIVSKIKSNNATKVRSISSTILNTNNQKIIENKVDKTKNRSVSLREKYKYLLRNKSISSSLMIKGNIY